MAVRVSSPVLIGRSNELERLRASPRLARQGGASATLVSGEAGVGKTRLVAEFVSEAQAAGAVVLSGGCIDLGEGALPYAPVVEALRGYVRRAEPDPLRAGVARKRHTVGDSPRAYPPLGAAVSGGGRGAGTADSAVTGASLHAACRRFHVLSFDAPRLPRVEFTLGPGTGPRASYRGWILPRGSQQRGPRTIPRGVGSLRPWRRAPAGRTGRGRVKRASRPPHENHPWVPPRGRAAKP